MSHACASLIARFNAAFVAASGLNSFPFSIPSERNIPIIAKSRGCTGSSFTILARLVEALVETDDAIEKHVHHVDKSLLGWIAGFGQRVELKLFDQLDGLGYVLCARTGRDGAQQREAVVGLQRHGNVAGWHLAL